MNYLLRLILVISVLPTVSPAQTHIDKGRYIAQLANCFACHTDIENEGQPLAGGRALEFAGRHPRRGDRVPGDS